MKKEVIFLLIILFVARVFAQSENWPGFNKGSTLINSNPTLIGDNLELKWVYKMDPQKKAGSSNITGSFRSKNMAIRDGQIALIIPNASKQYFGFINAETGELEKSFLTELDTTTDAEFNFFGVEGRDLRQGQFFVYWHKNGNIYAKSGGDKGESKAYNTSDGKLMLTSVGYQSSNHPGYFSMADNNNWVYQPGEGHTFYSLNSNIFISNIEKNLTELPYLRYILNSSWGQVFAKCGPFIVDGNWIYVLGPTNHPDIKPPSDLIVYDYSWLGANIRAFKMVGQNATPTDQAFEKGKTPEFYWANIDSFISNEGDTGCYPKAWALGNREIYLVTQGGVSHTPTSASVDFLAPLVLNGIDRYTGNSWSMNLGITCKGCTMDTWRSYCGAYTTFQPQIAYTNRTEEIVAVMLPEALKDSNCLNPIFNPYNTNPNLNTRISVVNISNQRELWTYEYTHGETTPNWNFGANTNTKMLIAGDSLYVAYVKTENNLANYIDTKNEYNLTLYIDKFNIENGIRTRFSFPLWVKANTIQLDDFATVDGRLYALVTYREYYKGSNYTGGAQLLASVGASEIPLETCSEQGGDVCIENEFCPGNYLTASDSARCCNVSCLSCNDITNCIQYLNEESCKNDFCGLGSCEFIGGVCRIMETCSDGILNQDETDIDCGGLICQACTNGKNCSQSNDCLSGNCAIGICMIRGNAPAIPSDLTALFDGTKIILNWTDNSDNENEFVIEKSTNEIDWTEVDRAGANVTSWEDTGALLGSPVEEENIFKKILDALGNIFRKITGFIIKI